MKYAVVIRHVKYKMFELPKKARVKKTHCSAVCLYIQCNTGTSSDRDQEHYATFGPQCCQLKLVSYWWFSDVPTHSFPYIFQTPQTDLDLINIRFSSIVHNNQEL